MIFFTMAIAKVNGIKIDYEIQGEGNDIPLILVSGWALKKQMWLAVAPPLSEHFKVITFDNRGCGKSDRPEGPYSLDDYADDILGLMDHLNLDKANLMGYALGAMIVMHFALKYVDHVDKLILLNTVAKYDTDDLVLDGIKINSKALDFQQNAPKKYFMKSAKMAFHRGFIKELEENPDKKFHNLWTVDEWVKEYNIDAQTPQDVENQGKAMLGLNLLEDLDKISAETLIIAGSNNKIHPKTAMEAMHEKIPNSTIEVLKRAGDMTYLSRAPEINQLVIDFLK
ncbi:MAG: 2-hydroxy-6-oxo-6-phenylhexa-2,4-dienoate hydrolase [Promethearchaeota archaeon]|nr:MAG: 2-hydroxy-6-oxo-6-phenylhexa-2,4-dienoate hydrolase [Candidatus Lokiarchaeota archaeon]